MKNYCFYDCHHDPQYHWPTSLSTFVGYNVLHLSPSPDSDQRDRIRNNTRCGQLRRKVTTRKARCPFH